MATAPTLPAVSVEEYLRTEYEPNCEYIDGILVSKPLPDRIHARLQALITAYLLSIEENYGLSAVTEIHTRIAPQRWRVPDIGGLFARSDDRYPDSGAPPLFTVEIVSRDEPWRELRAKVSDHLAIGVGAVIIADPYNKTVMVATQDTPLREITPPLTVSVPIPGKSDLQIDFDDLYRKLPAADAE